MIVNSIPYGITFEQFMGEHSSCPRNRLIARAFYLAGFIESWGRGIGKIRDEFVTNGLEAPVYKEEMGGISVYITRRKGLFGENDGVNDPVNDGVKVVDNNSITIDSDPVKITGSTFLVLRAIVDNPDLTYEEIQVIINCSRATVKRAIKVLRINKYIVREGSDKSGHWYVTEKGKKLINNQK